MKLEHITQAYIRISSAIKSTPVMTSQTLNELVNASVFVKAENLQKGGAFKFRGAYNAISLLSADAKKKGIVTHSSGNHAQAVAIVGSMLSIPTTIVMPKNAPQVKVEATTGYGATVVYSENSIEAREKACNELIEKHGYTLIHPYDNEDVIAGAGTTAIELVDEVGELDYLVVPIGGGGLSSGTSLYAKLSGKIRKVIGAEPEMADDAYRSLKANKLVTSHTPTTIADGLRTLLSERTFGYIRDNVDEIITVTEEQIKSAMKFYWERMKLVVEPSGAVPLALLRNNVSKFDENSRIGVIISGGNIDLTDFFHQL
ncbi:MAG: pyridoxal-phosphate dependent enzyme [Candidatus Heimdallarchaeota archaeon]|nr:pyridoxal-phosphate dependent enzyme [Candidatus Heimdallarchaeota archaeon]